MTRSVILFGVSGNDSLEAWRCKDGQLRPYFVRGDAVPGMVARMIETGNYDFDWLDTGDTWGVEVKEKEAQ